jgi:hypothetical protein
MSWQAPRLGCLATTANQRMSMLSEDERLFAEPRPSRSLNILHGIYYSLLTMDKYIGRQVFTQDALRSTQLVIPTVPLVYTTTHYLLHLFNTPLHETNPLTRELSEIVGHNTYYLFVSLSTSRRIA